MPEAVHLVEEITSAVSMNSTSFATRMTLSAAELAAAGFQNNDEALVFLFAIMRQANTATEQVYQVTYNGTAITSGVASPRIDAWANAVNTGRNVGFMGRVNLGTLADLDFDNQRQGTSANVFVDRAVFAAIRLADFGAENTDWWWNKSTTDVAHTTTYSGTSRASITFDAEAGEDYIVFSYAHIAVDSVSVNFEGRVMLDGSTLVAGDYSEEGESTTEERTLVCWGVLSGLSAASHTVTFESRDDTATAANNHRESALFIFKASQWPDLFYHLNSNTSVPTAADTQIATVTDTLSDDQTALIFGGGNMAQGTITGGWMWARLDGSTIPTPLTDDSQGVTTANWVANDNTDELNTWYMVDAALTAGALDVDLFVHQGDGTTGTRTMIAPRLLVWGLLQPDAGGDALVEVHGETIQGAESVLRPMGLRRVLGETINQSESVLRSRIMARVQNETSSISEAIIRARSMVRVLGEDINLAEAVINTRGLFKIIDEDLDISEDILLTLGRVQVISESLSITEQDLHIRGLLRVIEEEISLSEDTSTFLGLVRQLDETVEEVESVLKFQSFVRIVNEEAQLAETILRVRSLVRQEAEALNLSETELSIRALVRVLAESINISETIIDFRGLVQVVLEDLETAEDQEFYRGIFRVIEESLEISELDLHVAGIVMVIAEALNISEDDLRFEMLVRQVSEVLGLDEQDLTTRSLTRVLTESENLVEAVLKVQALLRTQNEDLTLTETDSWVRGLFKVVIEEIQLAEGIISKIAAAVTGVLKGWRTFAPRNRSLGGDRSYGLGDRVYDPEDRSHEN